MDDSDSRNGRRDFSLNCDEGYEVGQSRHKRSSWFDLLRRLKTSLDREPNCLRRGAHAEPLEQVRTMHLDRLLADFQIPGDLLVQQTVGHLGKNLPLADCKR